MRIVDGVTGVKVFHMLSAPLFGFISPFSGVY